MNVQIWIIISTLIGFVIGYTFGVYVGYRNHETIDDMWRKRQGKS